MAEHPKLGSAADEQRKMRIAREAEDWLREHDLQYGESSTAWKHIVDGVYETPWQEALAEKDEETVEFLMDLGRRVVSGVPTRACEACGETFEAARRDGNHQRFCSERCRKRDENRRLRLRGSNR